ncbi:hypothetical protein EPN29_03870 [bacterium]|nr:MAG: hypothetical protein EPN29_03870 [bacterium]
MRDRYRSFWWPAVLILIGIFALVVNSGLIPAERLERLIDLWPLLLIVIGAELIARRALRGAAGELAAVLIVLVAAGGAMAYVALAPNAGGGSHTLDASDRAGDLEHASLEVDVGAATITVSGSAGLGGDLYRAHIEYSGGKPDITLDRTTGDLRISQSSTRFGIFQSHRFVLGLQLDSSLPWKITSNTGAATGTLQLAGVQVASIELNTGASREDITLGPPSGIVPITINGGALTVHLHRPSGTPTSVSVSGGAVSLDADGRQQRGIGTQNWQSAGYDGATDGYRVEIDGGACTVTIDSTGAAA